MHTARYIVMYAVCMGNYIDELLANKSSSSSSSSNLCCLLARSVSIYVSLIASTMCDLFWQSPADQGDLADVVRASLQVAPRPAATDKLQDQADMSSSSSYDLQLVEEAGGHHQQHQQQQQLVVSLSHGEDEKQWRQQSMPASANCGDDLDAMLLLLPPPPAEAAMIHDGVQDQPELGGAHPISPHIKRRNKSQTKKVVCIPAASGRGGGGGGGGGGGEVVPSDLWAWRKYGQKPIKGSPYPRGYYRCSSSKGCSARKQVERSRADPTMLVVTYTSDHNHPWPTHRNALAGSTRPSSSAAKTISTTTTSCIHQYDDQSTDDHDGAARRRRHLKQEDAASLFAGITMDDNIIFSAGSNSQPQQQDQLPCTVDSKQQLLFEYPPHCSNFGFFD